MKKIILLSLLITSSLIFSACDKKNQSFKDSKSIVNVQNESVINKKNMTTENNSVSDEELLKIIEGDDSTIGTDLQDLETELQ